MPTPHICRAAAYARGGVQNFVWQRRLAFMVPGARPHRLPGYQVGSGFCRERLSIYFTRPLFHRRHEGIDDTLVIVRGHARVASLLNHVPQFSTLELL